MDDLKKPPCVFCNKLFTNYELLNIDTFYHVLSDNTYAHEKCLYEKLKECNRDIENLTPELKSIFDNIYNTKKFQDLKHKIQNDFNYHGFAGTLDDVRRDMYYILQWKLDGFDMTELWSLNHTIAKFVYPRLKEFDDGSHPSDLTSEQWSEILNKMIYSFEQLSSDEIWEFKDDDTITRIDDGLKLFAEYFRSLWN